MRSDGSRTTCHLRWPTDDRGMPAVVYVASWTGFQFTVGFLLPVVAVTIAYWRLYRRISTMPVIGLRSPITGMVEMRRYSRQ